MSYEDIAAKMQRRKLVVFARGTMFGGRAATSFLLQTPVCGIALMPLMHLAYS